MLLLPEFNAQPKHEGGDAYPYLQTLRPYQKSAVQFMCNRKKYISYPLTKSAALEYDDMG